MKIAVASQGTSLDAWVGVSFGLCSQFLVIDTETMDYVVISVPADQIDPAHVSLAAIRAVANQGAQVIITGQIKDICRQAMISLGIQVVDGVEHITVREAVERYMTGGAQSVQVVRPFPIKIAVASHGNDLAARLGAKGEPCTSFILVDPQTMAFQVVQVEQADSMVQTSVNAVRAAAKSGATVVVTSEIRPECCTALRALSITVALADEELTVREAVQAYVRGELSNPPAFIL
jgi:predicted Fe-Mo cluster-binding NifX family protein